jgi:hypothetical protein
MQSIADPVAQRMIAIAMQSLTQTITQRVPAVVTAGVSSKVRTQAVAKRSRKRAGLTAFTESLAQTVAERTVLCRLVTAVVHTLRISLTQPSQQTGLNDVVVQFLSRRFIRLRVNFGHSRPTHTFSPGKSR